MERETDLRSDAVAIWQAGVEAVLPRRLLRERVAYARGAKAGGRISGESFSHAIAPPGRVLVVGGGKAGAAMAAGLEATLAPWVADGGALSGLLNIPAGTAEPTRWIELHEARPAGRNEPTEAACAGATRMLEAVGRLAPADLCVALLSGGASALLPAPVDRVRLEDKLAVTRWLSGRGANIQQLNTVRKQLSRIKGGGLARHCTASRLLALIISDVLGDPLDVIASGPTAPDSTTPADALAVLAEFDPERALPESIYRHLERSAEQPPPPPPGCEVSNVILGNNATAVDAAGLAAERLGFQHAMHSAPHSEGDAGEIGRQLGEMALRMLREAGPDCLITGGEPVVQLAPEAIRGRGGRNQHLVLAAYQWLRDESDIEPDEWSRLVLLSGGTDGEDGPTDAAGAVLDAEVHRRAVERRLDVADALRRNDAYTFFDGCGGLLSTGPTGTNVCDVRVVAVRRR